MNAVLANPNFIVEGIAMSCTQTNRQTPTRSPTAAMMGAGGFHGNMSYQSNQMGIKPGSHQSLHQISSRTMPGMQNGSDMMNRVQQPRLGGAGNGMYSERSPAVISPDIFYGTTQSHYTDRFAGSAGGESVNTVFQQSGSNVPF